jgi:hypothetical protein
MGSTDLATDRTLSQKMTNILPYVNWRYKFSDTRNVRILYSTKAKQPDINQLQPVVDNSNPNYIRIGNPQLEPSFTHKINLSVYEYRPVSGRYLWGYFDYSRTHNGFTSATVTDSLARTISQTVNVDGNYNIYSNLSLTLPFFSKKLEIGPSANYSFFNNRNYVNREENSTKNSNFGGDINISIRPLPDTVEFGGSAGYSYSTSSSSLNQSSGSTYNTKDYSVWIELQFPFDFKLRSSANFTQNSQRTEGYNLDYTIWNASLSKTFFKSENLVVSIEASDILNESINNERVINSNSIIDTKSNAVGRYILMKAVLKFNSNKGNEESSAY